MDYTKLKDEINEIAEISSAVPEHFRAKCFELLLNHLLSPATKAGQDTAPVVDLGSHKPPNTNLDGEHAVPKPAAVPTETRGLSLEELERKHILEVLEMTGWRVSGQNGAAELLGLKPTTLEGRIKKLGIKRPA